MIKILVVTGGRNFLNAEHVIKTLDALKYDYISVGDCPTGVDFLVEQYCLERNIPHKIFVADWKKYGKLAGPIRNREMVKDAYQRSIDNFLLAFPGGKGTANCIKEAQNLHYTILEVKYYD